jgi:hypothetical protein
VANQLFGHGAKQHAFDSRVPMAAHHHEIERAIMFQLRQDLRTRAADTSQLRDRYVHLRLEVGGPAVQQGRRACVEIAVKVGDG